MAFESTFKAIDNTLHHDDGCSTALDYVEQSSWVLFLKYFDDLELTREQAAELEETSYERIISGEYQWNQSHKVEEVDNRTVWQVYSDIDDLVQKSEILMEELCEDLWPEDEEEDFLFGPTDMDLEDDEA